MPFNFIKTKVRSAFTLIELMVAIGVTALLVSLMLTITINVMGGWNKSSGSLTSGNQARVVLDMISRDLQAAIIKKDGNVWFAATLQGTQMASGGDTGMVKADNTADASWPTATGASKPSLSGMATSETDIDNSFYVPADSPPTLEYYRFKQAGTWLRFFTSATDTNIEDTTPKPTFANPLATVVTDTRISAPRAVAYQIVRAPVVYNSSEYRYQLFRSEVSSENSFAAGYDLFADAYNSTALITEIADDWTTIRAAGLIRRPETAAFDRRLVLANNVIDFGIRVFTRDNAGLLNTTPSFPFGNLKGFAATTFATAVPTTKPLSDPALASVEIIKGFPAVVEVFIRVLTDEGVLQIDNLENGGITGTWWDIALKNSKVFTRRIEIPATAL